MFKTDLRCVTFYCSCFIVQSCKSGNFHRALTRAGRHADLFVVCMCESHVELQGKEVCRPLVWMRRMSCLALREWSSFLWFLCCALYWFVYDSLLFSAALVVAMQLIVFKGVSHSFQGYKCLFLIYIPCYSQNIITPCQNDVAISNFYSG